jgi:methyl-accepting chemotaxis protein
MNFISNSIGRRLAIGLSVILAVTTGATAYAVWSLRTLEADYKRIANESMMQERNTQEWINILTLSGARNLVTAKFGDAATATTIFNAFNLGNSATLRARVTELQKEIFASLTTDEGRKLVDNTMVLRKTYLERLDTALAVLKEGKKEEAQKQAESLVLPAMQTYIASTHTLQEYTRKTILAREAEMQAATDRARTLLIVLASAALVLGAVVAWLLTRSITAPLKQAVEVAERVAAGDLRSTITVTHQDETGALLTAIGTMQTNLRDLISDMRRDVSAVSGSANQLAQSADDLAGSAAMQNDAAASTASSVQELTVSISQMSDSARVAHEVVEATAKVSDAGLEMGNRVSQEIGEIDRSVDEFASQMQALQGQAGEIGAVVKLIREIAEQTNLLALNAAIEAARAGEQGRGFAVVADEVRKLAERTSTATSDIQKTIESIQDNMGSAGNLLENVKVRVDSGVSTIANLIAPLQTLQSEAKRAADGLRELAHATGEQLQASEQIARNAERIAASASQGQAAVANNRDTSRQLQGLADHLLGSVARFQFQ